jgi:hypothetical protein
MAPNKIIHALKLLQKDAGNCEIAVQDLLMPRVETVEIFGTLA